MGCEGEYGDSKLEGREGSSSLHEEDQQKLVSGKQTEGGKLEIEDYMPESFIDLRSDTVTRPTRGMRAAIQAAEVGDDVFNEDPTVNRLQERVAAMLGKEAALFVPSGTMSNQVCIKAQTQPGDELICETRCHIYNHESGGPAALSGVTCRTIEGDCGVLDLSQLA